ncbi:MAG: ATP-grasp domain-containing protein, partial [Planctomycetes bacterium]|nr:ATP-grasp domain-containing protein [Planctomycetota bacterium]
MLDPPKNCPEVTVLITGVGAEGAHGVIEGLRTNGQREVRLIGVDADPQVASRGLVDRFYVVPKRNSPEFTSSIHKIVERECVDAIFPIPTAELEIFSLLKSFYAERNVVVIVSDYEGLAIANDKIRLYEHLQREGCSFVPKFRVVNNVTEFTEAVIDFGYPAVPVCFRRPHGTGARGFRILDEGADHLDILLNQNPSSTITTLASVKQILAPANPFPELLVQEYLPGAEYDVDVLCDQGSVLVALPRKNHRMLWG